MILSPDVVTLDRPGQRKSCVQSSLAPGPWWPARAINVVAAEDSAPNCPELPVAALLLLDDTCGGALAKPITAGRTRIKDGNEADSPRADVCAWLVRGVLWDWVDGELCPAKSSSEDTGTAHLRNLEVPADDPLACRMKLGIQLVERARARGIPFDVVACSSVYGRAGWLRAELASRQIQYIADIPAHQRVYLTESQSGWPSDPRYFSPNVHTHVAYRAYELGTHAQTRWEHLTLRISDRTLLASEFAAFPVTTVWQAETGQLSPRQEWLIIRRDNAGKCHYALSNAPADTPLPTLAQRKAQQFFPENHFQA